MLFDTSPRNKMSTFVDAASLDELNTFDIVAARVLLASGGGRNTKTTSCTSNCNTCKVSCNKSVGEKAEDAYSLTSLVAAMGDFM